LRPGQTFGNVGPYEKVARPASALSSIRKTRSCAAKSSTSTSGRATAARDGSSIRRPTSTCHNHSSRSTDQEQTARWFYEARQSRQHGLSFFFPVSTTTRAAGSNDPTTAQHAGDGFADAARLPAAALERNVKEI